MTAGKVRHGIIKFIGGNKLSKDLILNAKQYDIQPSMAKQIENTFIPMVDMLKRFENSYSNILEKSKQ